MRRPICVFISQTSTTRRSGMSLYIVTHFSYTLVLPPQRLHPSLFDCPLKLAVTHPASLPSFAPPIVLPKYQRRAFSALEPVVRVSISPVLPYSRGDIVPLLPLLRQSVDHRWLSSFPTCVLDPAHVVLLLSFANGLGRLMLKLAGCRRRSDLVLRMGRCLTPFRNSYPLRSW